VRILEIRQPDSRCQVRILEGEHYGKTAVVLLRDLGQIQETGIRGSSK